MAKTAELDIEMAIVRKSGYDVAIVGIDEAGRGCWAGSVFVGAVVFSFPMSLEMLNSLDGVNDSKTIKNHAKRTELATAIIDAASTFGVGYSNAKEIDEIGINKATTLAAHRALANLHYSPDFYICDYGIDIKYSHQSIKHGDALSLSIAAASLLAKTSRDNEMMEMAIKYPGYGFAEHKGYGTQMHTEALHNFGVCEIHRKTFKPIKQFLE